MVVELGNSGMSLAMDPGFGGRMTRLVDRRTGRNWLVEGTTDCDKGPDAQYLGAQAAGWDECFPTIDPCHSSDWKRNLRDHGEIWGRPVVVVSGKDNATMHFENDEFRFSRHIRLQDCTLQVSYEIVNRSDRNLPYIWSQHCLLDINEGEEIFFEGVGSFHLDAWQGIDMSPPTEFDWQCQSDSEINLSRVAGPNAGWAAKLHAPVTGKIECGVKGTNGTITFTWHQNDIPCLGLWLDYGGWPGSEPLHHMAIEPMTAMHDTVADPGRTPRWINPGEIHSWTLGMTIIS